MVSSHCILVIIIAGLLATTAMTLFVLLVNKLTGKRLNVIRILGTMLTSKTEADGSTASTPGVFVAGVTAHYAVGFLFTALYVIAWQRGLLDTTADWAIIGFVTGLFGIMAWRIYFAIHRFPPAVNLNIYLPTILFAHVVFGVVAGWTYMLMRNPGI